MAFNSEQFIKINNLIEKTIKINKFLGFKIFFHSLNIDQKMNFFNYYLDRYEPDISFELVIYLQKNFSELFSLNFYEIFSSLYFKRRHDKLAALCNALNTGHKIDFKSVVALNMDSREFLIYGLEDCRYKKIARFLDAYSINFSFKHGLKQLSIPKGANYDKKFIFEDCLMALNQLIAENYERIQKNKPIIYLLFCTKFSDTNSSNHCSLNIKGLMSPIHQKRKGPYYSITELELRHCYKLITQMPRDLSAVMMKSLKFVHVQLSNKIYTLKEVKPFWLKKNFSASLVNIDYESNDTFQELIQETARINYTVNFFKQNNHKNFADTVTMPIKSFL